MSSKKKYTTVGIDRDLLAKVDVAALSEKRSRSYMFEKMARSYFELLTWEKMESSDANKT